MRIDSAGGGPDSSILKPIAVLVGGNSLLSRRSGIGRMTLEIIEAVRNRPEISRLDILVGRRPIPPTLMLEQLSTGGEVAAGRARLLKRAKSLLLEVPGAPAVRDRWRLKQLMSAVRAAGLGDAVYHEPNMIAADFDGPIVTTVNDLSWYHHPEYHPKERVRWIRRNLPRTLAAATRFVAISQFTASAMTRELGICATKIDVVPLAAGVLFRPVGWPEAAAVLGRHGLQDRGYVLSVSTLEPRKNFDRLVAAHLALPAALRARVPLVIAGGGGWGQALSSKAAERARQEGCLRLLGHVPDGELAAIYARSAVFAFPSLYEGFGLPVIEAMAAGAPVLASSTTATAETAGDAACLVDPMDVEAISEGLRRILEDEVFAARLRVLGARRAAEFSWERTGTGLIESWRRARG